MWDGEMAVWEIGDAIMKQDTQGKYSFQLAYFNVWVCECACVIESFRLNFVCVCLFAVPLIFLKADSYIPFFAFSMSIPNHLASQLLQLKSDQEIQDIIKSQDERYY